MTEPTRFFFVHLQKTAGTSLLIRLRGHFGDDAVYPHPSERGNIDSVINVGYLVDRFAEQRSRLRVVTGHFPLATTELLGAPFVTLTLLRDPVERTLSFLRHRRRREARHAGSSLEEIYAEPFHQERLVRNHMVKMLSLTPAEAADGALSEVEVGAAHLDRAIGNLRDRVDVFGLQTRFDAFCAELEARFGWGLGPSLVANATPPVPVDNAFRARIAEDNALDGALYRVAEELWWERHPDGR